MRLVKLPNQPEQLFEEGFELRGGMLSLMTGTAEFVKFKRPLPYPPIQRDRTIIINFGTKDGKLVENLEQIMASFQDSRADFMADCMGYRHKVDLLVDGCAFYGALPIQRLNIEGDWLLSVDYHEEVMSHRQQYRYKHFPVGVKRIEFTTTEDFITRILMPDVQHVVVDSNTAQLLSDDFESFQKNATVPPSQYRKVGLILEVHGRLIFSDMALDRNMQWVNENPGSDSSRAQFIIVRHDELQPFIYETEI